MESVYDLTIDSSGLNACERYYDGIKFLRRINLWLPPHVYAEFAKRKRKKEKGKKKKKKRRRRREKV
jgi:hypothetical protein